MPDGNGETLQAAKQRCQAYTHLHCKTTHCSELPGGLALHRTRGRARAGSAAAPGVGHGLGRGLERHRAAAEHHDHRRHRRPARRIPLRAQQPDVDAPQRVRPGEPVAHARRVYQLRHRPIRPALPHLQYSPLGPVKNCRKAQRSRCLIHSTHESQQISGLPGGAAVVPPPRHDLQNHDAEAEHVRFHGVVPSRRVLGRQVSANKQSTRKLSRLWAGKD